MISYVNDITIIQSIWELGLAINSCTLNNFLTALWLWSHCLVDPLENLPVEMLLKKIIMLLKIRNQSEAKELWASYLQHVKGMQILTHDKTFDVLGSEKQMLFQHLKELQEINCTAVCLECDHHQSVQVREVFPPIYCNIGEILQSSSDAHSHGSL